MFEPGFFHAALQVPQLECAILNVVERFFCILFGPFLLRCVSGPVLLQLGLCSFHHVLGLILSFEESLERRH